MAHERKCSICGGVYRYCNRCAEFKDQPRWKSVYCSEKCKDNYKALNDFAFSLATAEEAKSRLVDENTIINPTLIPIIEKINGEIKPVIKPEVVQEEKPVFTGKKYKKFSE